MSIVKFLVLIWISESMWWLCVWLNYMAILGCRHLICAIQKGQLSLNFMNFVSLLSLIMARFCLVSLGTPSSYDCSKPKRGRGVSYDSKSCVNKSREICRWNLDLGGGSLSLNLVSFRAIYDTSCAYEYHWLSFLEHVYTHANYNSIRIYLHSPVVRLQKKNLRYVMEKQGVTWQLV